MNKLAILLFIISFPAIAMSEHTENVSGNKQKGKEGFFQDAINLAASPVAAVAEQAAKIAMESVVKYKEELIGEAVSKATAANAAQIKALQDQVNRLQKRADDQDKGCCSIQ